MIFVYLYLAIGVFLAFVMVYIIWILLEDAPLEEVGLFKKFSVERPYMTGATMFLLFALFWPILILLGRDWE